MQKLLESGSSPQSPVEARACVLSRLRERSGSCGAALQCCRQAAQAALYVVWADARRLLRGPPALGGPGVSGAAREAAVSLQSELRAVFNERFIDELLETTEVGLHNTVPSLPGHAAHYLSSLAHHMSL